jgi:hypothetical protein
MREAAEAEANRAAADQLKAEQAAAAAAAAKTVEVKPSQSDEEKTFGRRRSKEKNCLRSKRGG